jgi:putative nucleotidyltransferase with HDIG domain
VYLCVIDWFPAHSTTTTDPRTVARLRWQSFALVRRMAREVDAQHRATVGHSERTARLAMALGEVLGWSSRDIERLGEAALVHDIGKMCVPAEILGSPVALTDEQMAVVRHHPRISAEMVAPAFDAEQVSWVRHHHERWDGRGYPDGLRAGRMPARKRPSVCAVGHGGDPRRRRALDREPLAAVGAQSLDRHRVGAE